MIDRRITIVAVVALLAICAGAISVSAVWDDGDALNAQTNDQAVVQTWTSGDCTCKLYDDGVFRVTTSTTRSDMQDYTVQTDLPWYQYRDDILSVTTVGVTHIGDYAFIGCTHLASVTIGEILSKSISIGRYAFSACTSLSSVTIGNGVSSIGDGAFNECSALPSITIPGSVKTIGSLVFVRCTSLTTIEFPAQTWNVTNIGAEAFSLGTPSSPVTCTVYSINNVANHQLDLFKGYSTTLNYEASSEWQSGACTVTLNLSTWAMTVSGNGAMDNYSTPNTSDSNSAQAPWAQYGGQIRSLTVNSGVTTVGTQAFSGCTALTFVSMSGTVTDIGANSFNGCTSIAKITIPSSVTSIGNVAFYGCNSLASVTVGNSVTTIGSYAFQKCTSLTSITFTSPTWNITSIGADAFSLGTSSKSVTCTVESLNNMADQKLEAYKGGYTTFTYESLSWTSGDCTCTLDNGVMTVSGNGAMTDYPQPTIQPWYQYMSDIQSLVVADGVTKIGANTFIGCTNLQSVSIGGYVSTIGVRAFASCSSLTSVSIPNNVTYIDAYALQYCTSLTEITFDTDTWNITSIGMYAFSLGTSEHPVTCTVISPGNVADGKLEAYKGDYTTFSYRSIGYDVTIQPNNPDYGSVDESGPITVSEGSSVSAEGNVLTIVDNAHTYTITATPASPTAQYSYSFDSWAGIPQSGTITQDTNITAVFTQTLNDYTVTISVNNPDYGSVSPASITVPYGTAISYSNNELIVGDNTSVATPSASTAQYNYIFSSWDGVQAEGGTVEGDMTVTAVFEQVERDRYIVTFEVNNAEYGNTSEYQIQVLEGSTVSVQENVITIGGIEVTQTPAQNTEQYKYSFQDWGTPPQTIVQNTTITVNFARDVQTYEVTIQVNESEWGSVTPSTATVTVPYGTVISAEGAVLTIGTTQYTAVPTESTAKDIYKFVGWLDIPESGQITGNLTVTAEFSHELQKYTVTFVTDPQDGSYGTVSVDSIKVDADSVITIDGNRLLIGETVIATAVPEESDIQYKFALDKWVGVPEGGILADCTITAKFVRTLQQYQVTFKVPDFDKGEVFIDGTTIYKDTAITVDFGTPIRIDGQDIVIGIDAHIASALGVDEYTFINWVGVPVGEKVRGNIEITAVFQQVEIVLSGEAMYCVTGMPAPWMYNPFTAHLNREVMGVWTIKDPNHTGLTIDGVTGAFGGVISPGSEYGTATIEVIFTTDEGREVSATFQLYYEPPLIIKG